MKQTTETPGLYLDPFLIKLNEPNVRVQSIYIPRGYSEQTFEEWREYVKTMLKISFGSQLLRSSINLKSTIYKSGT